MKTPITPRLALLAVVILLPSAFLLSQGLLTPPGAPAPMMKTLDQIEARTPISTVPFTISASGSYYLTGNLAIGTAGGSGIIIDADDVSLDLNGFTLSSTASPVFGVGVNISGTRRNITVRNGTIRGATTYSGSAFATGGFFNGVSQGSAASANIHISDLKVLGVGGDGISLPQVTQPTFVVERCTVAVCAGFGIRAATVRDCVADTAGDTAISADVATNCTGVTVNTANANAIGILAGTNVVNCRGTAVSGFGVQGNNVSNSHGTSTSGVGLSASTASNCSGISASGIGLGANNAANCFGSSTSGDAGLDANPGTASFCRGQRDGGIAIDAGIAIGCTVLGTGTVSSSNKLLGTP